jgi:hypothetical protein
LARGRFVAPRYYGGFKAAHLHREGGNDVGKGWAALGSVAFFVLAPGCVVGLLPWWLTGWRPQPVPGGLPIQMLGGVLLVGGLGVLVHGFVRFVVEGRGTPAPVAPTECLVVGDSVIGSG